MARVNGNSSRKKLVYFFLNNKIHRVLKLSRAKDELVAWSYLDKKRMLYSYSQVKKNMENAYTTKEVADILKKHKVTIEDYILDGKIKKPQKVYPLSNPDSKWFKFMFSESDIMDIHQFILESGYSKNMPSKAELRSLLKNNIILYTKTDSGYVPVWEAD
jgi:reverse gyrase